MGKEDLPLWPAKFTEVEALQYFEKTFEDYIVLNWDWDWFVVNAWLDEPEHREVCLDIQVVSKQLTMDMSIPPVYGGKMMAYTEKCSHE